MWQRYEGQVHGTENSRQNNLHRKQCMKVPEEGTAGKHRVKNLSHQLHIIKKTQTIQRFRFFLQTYLHVKLEHLLSSNLRKSTRSSTISNLILVKNSHISFDRLLHRCLYVFAFLNHPLECLMSSF